MKRYALVLIMLLGIASNQAVAADKHPAVDRKRKASHSSDEEMNAATQHKCPVCGYSSARKYNLTTHMRIHTGERPFKCVAEGCPYSTAYKSDITKHMHKHTGEKIFKCLFEDCDYSATISSNLIKHMRIHTGERPFKCVAEDCGYSTTCKSNLTRHIRVKHPAANDHNQVGLSAAAAHDESVAKQALPMLSGTVVNDAHEDDNTQLQAAMEEGTAGVQTLLATQNINVNAIDQDGCTALHFATLNYHTEIVKALLLTPGINVNATDLLGYTALHLAALLGRTEVVQALLEHGANATLALIDGNTAADLADTPEIRQLILDAAAQQQ